ncbi:flavodoxin family protein [Metallumcola ferriviriculae]|uniref:Flavodoxin family protein n=1 Tax=Metallumcola ferriviriculae TaxID=3039180 RepID=A0AAU0UN86_9FIRM|nr:flavodoxin family protein [Desulfitibacteraceae bacterium MK1]
MKVLIITASPNKNGLTAACAEAAKQGVEAAGGNVRMVRLNDLEISQCQACGNGWGNCLKEHRCKVQDDFQDLHKFVDEADGYVMVTPVYWGEMSESAKMFTDRLRRCEASNREGNNKTANKPYIAVAAAGGTGNGTLTCLSSMERLFGHMRSERFDLIGITRKNRDYKLDTIRLAAEKMVVKSMPINH